MNCNQVDDLLEAYINGKLTARDARAIAEHHLSCSLCNKAYLDTLEIRALLQKLPVPAPSENFFDRAIKNATDTRSNKTPVMFAVFSSAIAAGLAVWFIISGTLLTVPVDTTTNPDSLYLVMINSETKTIKLAIESEQSLEGVEMSIELTPNLELAGFGSRQVINWETRLNKGTNVIKLPIIGLAAGNGEITARVRMKGKEKIMRIQTLYRAPDNAWQIIGTNINA